MCVYILDRERDDQKNKGEREKKKILERERESALRGGAKERGWSDHAM